MKIIYKNEKGATSVLIIFMMIVLVSLGAFSITAANVNYKLSKEVLKYNTVYYDLENKANIFTMVVDNEIEKSEDQAIDYIKQKKYQEDRVSGMPDYVQRALKETYDPTNKKKSLSKILNEVYLFYSRENLLIVKEKYQDSNIVNSNGVEGKDEIWAEVNFKSDLNTNANLKVKMKIMPISYDITDDGNRIKGVKSDEFSRYKIEEFNEWQLPVEYENGVELWEGVLK